MLEKKTQKITIVIPTYNEARYISKLLDTLVEQTYKDFDITIVDKSTDTTLNVIAQYEDRLQIHVFTPESERGISRQRNFGVDKANSDYILFLDADSRLKKNALETCVQLTNSGYDLIFFPLRFDNYNIFDAIAAHVYNLYALGRYLVSPISNGAFLLVKRSVFLDIGGFNPEIKFKEDFDLVNRIAKAGYRYKFNKKFLYKTSDRRIVKMGRTKYYLQFFWDGIWGLFPKKIDEKLSIGYEPDGYDD